MTPLSDYLVQDVHRHLKPYYANWPPDRRISIGDFGRLKDDHFAKKSNIRFLGINVEEDNVEDDISDPRSSKYVFRSGNISISEFGGHAAGAAQEVLSGKVAIEIKFSEANSILFNAVGCVVKSIKDPLRLKKDILGLWGETKWDDDWYIVTQIVEARSATLIVSSDKGASIRLEAVTETQRVDLADAGLKLRINSEDKIGLSMVTETGWTPLISFSKIRRKRFGGSTLEPHYLTDDSTEDVDSFQLRHDLLRMNKALDEEFDFGEAS
jgi:hypothetical protein